MLLLKELELVQFRNYAHQKWVFKEKIVGICGFNGTGKTNLLDAIYYLGFARSYFARTDAQNVRHGDMGMRLNGQYLLNNEPQQITCILRETNRKELSLNEEQYKKISDHVGKFPCVMIAPDDVDLITGSGEARRKMIDTILSQTNKMYLVQLMAYTKLLQQRNSLLKQAEQVSNIDYTLLQTLNHQLIESGTFIYQTRTAFLKQYIPLAIERYTEIAGKTDGLTIQYESQLNNDSFESLLQSSLQKDLILQRTTKGIHRDDLILTIDVHPFKNEASQGQRKSLLFALKLAEWEYLKSTIGFAPILLLDDVFEKLDEKRMFQLLEKVCSDEYGQVFITDTHAQRLQQQLTQTGAAFELLTL
ncbi:MAG: DNA replication and repair protein RecF [Chitinophagaceae bacterium]|nr:MAG: DNA replication and repair protein [Chitinophagaceae bacterium]TXT33581.1 MAG: DNA replication and repair protein RecF [Chitinophagaceae bacterium]